MKIFNPTIGGHPLKNDDLILMQTAFKEAIKGLFSFASTNTKLILSGIVVTDINNTISCSSGYAFYLDEIYEVVSTSFAKQNGGTYFLKIIETTLPPSPVTYEDQSIRIVHVNRQMRLIYNDSISQGDILSNFYRISSQGVRTGTVLDWYGDVNANFDSSGMGVNDLAGYAICNGNTFNGYVTPDLRGRFIVSSTDVPAAGAPALDNTVGTYTYNTTGGTKDSTLIQDNLPNVNFPVTDLGHTHIVQANSLDSGGSGKLVGGNPKLSSEPVDGQETTSTSTTGISVNSGGSGATFTNLPPFFALVKIIKIGN